MRMGTGMSGISDGYPLIRRPCHLRQNRTGNINHGLNLCVTPILFGQNGCRCNYGPVPPLFFRAPFGANGVFGYSFGPALGSHTSFEHRGGNRWSCRYIYRHGYIYPCMTKNMLLFWCFSVFSSGVQEFRGWLTCVPGASLFPRTFSVLLSLLAFIRFYVRTNVVL